MGTLQTGFNYHIIYKCMKEVTSTIMKEVLSNIYNYTRTIELKASRTEVGRDYCTQIWKLTHDQLALLKP